MSNNDVHFDYACPWWRAPSFSSCLLLVWEKEILFPFSFLLVLHPLFYFSSPSFFSSPFFILLLFFPSPSFLFLHYCYLLDSRQSIQTIFPPPNLLMSLLKHLLLHFGYLTSGILAPLLPLKLHFTQSSFFFFFWCFLKKQLCQLFFVWFFLIIFLCRIGNIRFLLSLLWKCLI